MQHNKKQHKERHHAHTKKPGHSHTKQTGLITITRGGLGFLATPDAERDIRIENNLLGTALNGDTVEVLELPQGVRRYGRTGKVTRVLTRAKERFVGTLTHKHEQWILTPDDARMYAPLYLDTVPSDADENDKALVHMSPWSDSSQHPTGTVLEIIGPAGAHETEMRAILLAQDFTPEFPQAVEDEAHQLQKTARTIPTDEMLWREDFRTVPTFTIDPDNAKDFDDALSIQELPNGNYEIGIHIADVTHYVHPQSALDREAQKRATSVYLVDRTIPMLPEGISNDLCSLNPHEDKRAFAALFEITSDAQVVATRFAKTLIASDQRFTYKSAQEVLDGEPHQYRTELTTLWSIAQQLRKVRVAQGAIEFQSDEIGFELNDDNSVRRAYVKEILDTMSLIEEFMLLANRAVAKHIATHCSSLPASQCVGIYRVHNAPDPERLAELDIFLQALGHEHFNKPVDKIQARDIAQLLRDTAGTPEASVIQMTTLRSMAKAVYSDTNTGHFSLGFKYYTHFTSPIRRYPDVMVHRILWAQLTNTRLPHEEIVTYRHMTSQSSQREVEATRAERDSIKFKQVEYLSSRVGTVFTGTITGVTKGGFFVSENETHAEGMVRINTIPGDWFELDEKQYRLIGQKTKQQYRIGDTVQVKLTRADSAARELDWEVVV